MSEFYIGIDTGKYFSEICVLDEDREPIYCDKIATLDEASWREALGLFDGNNLHAAFEIGSQYDWLYDLLREYCVDVQVINAEAFAIISRSQKKTDKIDALKIAEGIWRNDLPTVFVPAKHIRKDRRLVSHLHKLSQRITSTKTQVRNILFSARLTCPYTDIAGGKAKTWLLEVALPKMDDQDQLLMGQLIDQLSLLVAQQDKLESVAFERLKSYEQSEIVMSIPGFGVLVSLSALCAIADRSRFQRPDQLASYFGLCGRISQSGGLLLNGRITKRGNHHLRWLLGQAITHLIRRDARARARYLKLKRKKRPNVARVALMRWIITILWHMLSKNEKFRLNGTRGKHYVRRIYVKKVA